LSRPNDLGHLAFGARLDLDYALNPLVYRLVGSDPNSEVASVVEHQLALQLGVSFGLWDRIVLFAGMPFNLVLEGEQVTGQPRADGASIGDLYFGARGRLFGEADDAFAIALQVTGTAPTARAARFQSRFAGDGNFTFQPELLFEIRIAEWVNILANAGFLFREEQDFGTLRVEHDFTWGAGATLHAVRDVLDIQVETWGVVGLSRRDGESLAQVSPIEGVIGATVFPVRGLRLGAAVGTGLQRGYGAGDFRAILSVGYATEGEVPAGDRDGDGIADDVDECPDAMEDVDEFQDDDGCPDEDNDRDGIADGDDRCPNEAEDRDGLGDEDGCPELDFDGDGAADEADRCPTEPGVALAVRPECTGCPTCDESTPPPREPDAPPPPVGDGSSLGRVRFEVNQWGILPSEQASLQAALEAVRRSSGPVIVEGHADVRGSEPNNEALSRRRARRVLAWLVRHGADRSRLRAVGCGERYPEGDVTTRAGRTASRRVEIRSGSSERAGCVEADIPF
ncbi:MAG: OmpA family protein, partial [Sandaracinaceae bacterium]